MRMVLLMQEYLFVNNVKKYLFIIVKIAGVTDCINSSDEENTLQAPFLN